MKKSIKKLNFVKTTLSDFSANHLVGGGPKTVGGLPSNNCSAAPVCVGTQGASGCIATVCHCTIIVSPVKTATCTG
jgi:hypothetical protein